MAYLILFLIAVATSLISYYFSNFLIYRFYYHPKAHSGKWFWKRDLSDEDLDSIARLHSKKFAKITASIISLIWILMYSGIIYLKFTGSFGSNLKNW